MIRDIVSVPVTADQEDAARLLTDRNLLAVPVVDDEQRLLGIITADDVADVLEQEATEDFERLGGSEPLDEPYMRASPFLLARKRVGWLLALFLAEAYTGTVLRHYQDETAKVLALSFFIPLLIGTGGNVGSQVVTTIIRAMAVGEVRFRDVFKIVWKEARTALMLGAAMAAAAFIRAWTLGVSLDIGLTVSVTVTCIVDLGGGGWLGLAAGAAPVARGPCRRLRAVHLNVGGRHRPGDLFHRGAHLPGPVRKPRMATAPQRQWLQRAVGPDRWWALGQLALVAAVVGVGVAERRAAQRDAGGDRRHLDRSCNSLCWARPRWLAGAPSSISGAASPCRRLQLRTVGWSSMASTALYGTRCT